MYKTCSLNTLRGIPKIAAVGSKQDSNSLTYADVLMFFWTRFHFFCTYMIYAFSVITLRITWCAPSRHLQKEPLNSQADEIVNF